MEKDALAGVLAPVARKWRVTLMVNRGYSSTSAMRESGLRVRSECAKIGAKEAVVLYLGDMDPSGEDMVRDVRERLRQFVNQGIELKYTKGRPYRGGEVNNESKEEIALRQHIDVDVRKLALSMEQVEEYDPPPNPAKMSDSRAAKYVAEFGTSSWEVDALPPVSLREIIEDELEGLIDVQMVDEVKEKEAEDKLRLRDALASLAPSGKKRK